MAVFPCTLNKRLSCCRRAATYARIFEGQGRSSRLDWPSIVSVIDNGHRRYFPAASMGTACVLLASSTPRSLASLRS
jgi:hypothetical protein